jgi:hypothetical protein
MYQKLSKECSLPILGPRFLTRGVVSKYIVNKRQWAVQSGPWEVNSGKWTEGSEQRTVNSGQY